MDIIFCIIGICFLCSLAAGSYVSSLEAKRTALEQEAAAQQSELAELKQKSGKIDIYTAAKTIDKSMVNKITYYDSIGTDIPSKVWLTLFYADTNGAYGIKGQTTSVDDVYLFFRNIKSRVPDSDLILSTLSVDDKQGTIDIEKTENALYTFELTNNKFGSVKITNPNATVPSDSNNPNATSEAAPGGAGSVSVPNLPDLPQ